eukprot:9466547-Heterocapsa_arctica.AAC.2
MDRAQAQQVCASTALAAGSVAEAAVNGFDHISGNVLRCWLKCVGAGVKPFNIIAFDGGCFSSSC